MSSQIRKDFLLKEEKKKNEDIYIKLRNYYGMLFSDDISLIYTSINFAC